MDKRILRKGKTFEEIFGVEKAKEIKEKQSKHLLGQNNPNYKKDFSKEHRINLGKAHIGKHPRTEYKKGHNKNKTLEEIYGEKRAKEIKKKKNISMSGKNHPFFRKGVNTGKKYPKELYPNYGLRSTRYKQIFPMKDTKIELKIQNYLKLLHIEFITHYYISEITHAYQCDIFIPSKKLVIEADGCYWHGCPICNKNLNDFQEKQKEEDEIRTKELIEKGFIVIRLKEHDIKKMELNEFKEKLE